MLPSYKYLFRCKRISKILTAWFLLGHTLHCILDYYSVLLYIAVFCRVEQCFVV